MRVWCASARARPVNVWRLANFEFFFAKCKNIQNYFLISIALYCSDCQWPVSKELVWSRVWKIQRELLLLLLLFATSIFLLSFGCVFCPDPNYVWCQLIANNSTHTHTLSNKFRFRIFNKQSRRKTRNINKDKELSNGINVFIIENFKWLFEWQ